MLSSNTNIAGSFFGCCMVGIKRRGGEGILHKHRVGNIPIIAPNVAFLSVVSGECIFIGGFGEGREGKEHAIVGYVQEKNNLKCVFCHGVLYAAPNTLRYAHTGNNIRCYTTELINIRPHEKKGLAICGT